jgi:hypothetical protein
VIKKIIPTYTDETKTGRPPNTAFQGLGNATIAARIEDHNGFEWLRKFGETFHPGAELKSKLVLEIMKFNSKANTYILDHIGEATIFIVDFCESYRILLAGLSGYHGNPPLTRGQAKDFITSAKSRFNWSSAFLAAIRDHEICSTIIPEVEGLIMVAAKDSGIYLPGSGLPIDRRALQQANDQTFKECVARFAVAFGDAIADEQIEANIIQAYEKRRYFSSAYIAFKTLGETLSVNRYYDKGNVEAFNRVQDAHTKVIGILDALNSSFLNEQAQRGSLKQVNSKQYLGIQAADIAAGIASREYERFPDNGRDGAICLKTIFNRVLLNDEWI